MNATLARGVCERCTHEPAARYLAIRGGMFVCWSCFDIWRKRELGDAYKFAKPIEELRAEYEAQFQPFRALADASGTYEFLLPLASATDASLAGEEMEIRR